MRGNKLFVAAITALLFVGLLPMLPVRAAVPPPEYLYCNGYDATFTGWTAVGSSPYLDAVGDGNYIEATSDGALMGYFYFEDIAPIPSDAMIEGVWLEGYTDGPHSDDVDFDAYTVGLGAWLGSLYADDEPKWVQPRWISPGQPISDFDPNLLSESGLNAWGMAVYVYDPGNVIEPGNIIDSLRLYVTYTEYIPPMPVMSVSPTTTIGLPGESFDVEIIVNPPPYVPVYDLYGFEFKLGYDPAVLQATSITLGSMFPVGSIEWANEIDNVAGVAWYSVSMPYGSPKGVNGDGVLAVISFNNVGGGPGSELDLYDTLWGNRYGLPIAHLVWDGEFVYPPPTGDYFVVCLKTAQKEHRKFVVSKDEDGYQTLSASIMNYGDTTWAYAEFKIFDGMGAPVGTLSSPVTWISQADGVVRLSVDWNGYSVPEDYVVEARCYYMDSTGAWHVGPKGDPNGAKSVMATAFRVEY